MRRWVGIAALVALMLALAAACGDDEDEDGGDAAGGVDSSNPFRIAVVADLTGPAAGFYGVNVSGAKAAVTEINKRGGILGREVVLDIRDGATDPAKGDAAGTELILSKNYQVLYAPTISAPNLAKKASDAKMIIIAASGDPRLQDPKQLPYSFDLSSAPVDQGKASMCYIASLPYKKLAIFYNETVYGKVVGDVWNTELPKKGKTISGTQIAPQGALDITAQLQKLKADNPEALLVVSGATDVAAIVDGMKNLKWDIPIIGESALSSTNFEKVLKSLGDIPKNSTMAAWGINVRDKDLTDGQKRSIDALKRSRVTIEFPLYNYTYGWDSIYLVKWAAEKAKSDKADDLVKALETINDVKDQGDIGTVLVGRHVFTKDFHGLINDRWVSAKLSKLTDGLYEADSKEYKVPC